MKTQSTATAPAVAVPAGGPTSAGAGDPTLLAVAQLRDPRGVLSIYVDASPDRASGPRPGWHLAAENALRSLRECVNSERPTDRARAIRARLAPLESATREFLYGRGHGRGRAVFLPLSGGQPITIGLQVRLPDLVVLDEAAYVGPLVAAYDAGRPVGIATVSRAGVRILEQRLGTARDLETAWVDEATADWGEVRTSGLANSAAHQPTATTRDHFDRRMDARRAPFLEAVGDRLLDLAALRGWETIAICGDGRVTAPVQSRVASDGRIEVLTVRQTLEHRSAAELSEAVSSELDRSREARQLRLVRQVVDASRGRGKAVLGLSETLHALNEGRVARLVVDIERRRQGRVFLDGRLAAAGERLPGIPDKAATTDDHFTERVIERALETGAEITPAEGTAAGLLAGHDGIAAVLRW